MTRNRVILGLGLLIVLAASVGGVWYGRERERQASYEAGLTALAEDRYADALILAGAYPDDPDHDHVAAQVYLSDDRAFRDAEKGLALQRAAAEAGQMRAAYFLARYLLDHDPDETQRQDILRYLTEAAECGMPMANWMLARYWVEQSRSSGVENLNVPLPDRMELYKNAAWAGIPGAQSDLARNYLKRMPDPDEQPEAWMEQSITGFTWFYIASWGGERPIQDMLEEIENDDRIKNSPSDRAVFEFAKDQAIRWQKKILPTDLLRCGFSPPYPY